MHPGALKKTPKDFNKVKNERYRSGSLKEFQDFLCPDAYSLAIPSPSSHDVRKPVILRRVKRVGGDDASAEVSVSSAHGHSLLDMTFDASFPDGSLEIFNRMIEILHISQKKTAARVICSIAPRPPNSDADSPGKCFHLCAKIMLPDNRELLEASLYDRALGLELSGIDNPLRGTKPWTPRDFYDSVYVPDKGLSLSRFPRIDKLKCQLYPFQQRAIAWLLQREKGIPVADKADKADSSLPHGFVTTKDGNGNPCFFSPFLGIMTSDQNLVQGMREIRGGLLAEEMGLGKTVEIIGLICLHKKQDNTMLDEDGLTALRKCPATLVITPPSILSQWKNELQTLAPDLRVTTYEGFRPDDPRSNADYAEAFDGHDIVLTTYNVLAHEIHHSGHVPERTLRHQKVYARRLSPLTQTTWWRVVLDEAQMIESGVSNAARVAQMIPRINAWCVSGTPVRQSQQDLRGLLVFLRFPPYCYSAQIWERLIFERRDLFRQIFGTLALRHTKELIKDDIQLPAQRRVVITVPFTTVEEQNYLTLYEEMADACGLDTQGNPLADGWDPNAPSTIETMRTWLLRLRQTCLHAEVGSRNRRALGKGKQPLRTVDEVLEVMTEQNLTALRTEERALLVSQARRGQMLEHAQRSREALAVWLDTLRQARTIVSEARQRLKLETSNIDPSTMETTAHSEGEPGESSAQTGASSQRLRSALELEHMLLFFTANAYFQIKSSPDETTPRSTEFAQLEQQEEDYYEQAKLVRKELLVEARGKADLLMCRLQVRSKSSTTIPDCTPPSNRGGIESRGMFEKFGDVSRSINQQASQIRDWREKAVNLLSAPLLDEEETKVQGDEYETSTQLQDTVYSYIDALRAVVSDFYDAITGQKNMRIEYEVRTALQRANEGGGHSPELLRELLHIRQGLKPPAGVGSIRGVLTDLRELRTTLRASLERGNLRAGSELGIVNESLETIQSMSKDLTKAAAALQREVEQLTDIMNARLDYYRQLQQISDTVAPYEEDMNDEAFALAMGRADQAEGRLRTRIATLKSTARYLDHIRVEASDRETDRLCIICQQSFEIGVLTVCGHSFCAECIRLWRRHHSGCPTCKQRLQSCDLHPITFKPLALAVQEEKQTSDANTWSGSEMGSPKIYSDIQMSTLNEIKNIDMDGASYGTKIDSIARHILWLREHDAGSKSIVFSQFRDFLSILGAAFTSFKIGHISVEQKDSVRRFKDDAGIECFLMHARGNSSGLTLVNATHVILCEPLINTAIELQAVARVHRIGQHQPTTVWVYVVENTVEKSIYDISVERRLAHIGHTSERSVIEGAGRSHVTEGEIEAANTLELEGATLGNLLSKGTTGGEMVPREELWNCLFRQKPMQAQAQAQAVSPAVEVEMEVGRQLRAAAADGRQQLEGR
ncbi:MAG: hypothetical protein Q9174_000173 [Haloplaca sp. 1 TL-2023]